MKRGLEMLNYEQYWFPITLGLLWSVFWKGWALWKAAKKDDKAWFIALLIINTLGILEMFYIFVFSKRSTQINPKTPQ